MEYHEPRSPPSFKRYCKSLTLQDDAALVEQDKHVHAPGVIWPEIPQGLREVGVLHMEIYLAGRQLFMIMDTEADFDHEQAMATLANKSRQAEWETYVSQFLTSVAVSTAAEKWQLMERIYVLQ